MIIVAAMFSICGASRKLRGNNKFLANLNMQSLIALRGRTADFGCPVVCQEDIFTLQIPE